MLGANVAGFILGTALFSMFLMLTLYMQQVLGYSAMKTGVAYLAVAGTSIIWANVAAALVTRVGVQAADRRRDGAARRSGCCYFTQVSVGGSYVADLLPGFLIIAFGMALCFVPISIAALAGVQQAEAGLASGLINTSQQIGGAVGIALLSTIAISRTENEPSRAGRPLPVALTSGFQLAFWVGAAIAARRRRRGARPDPAARSSLPSERARGRAGARCRPRAAAAARAAPAGLPTTRSAASRSSGGLRAEATATRTPSSSPSSAAEARRGRSCRRRRRARARGRARRAGARRPCPCARSTGGRSSSTLRPKRATSPSCARPLGDRLEQRERLLLVLRAGGSGSVTVSGLRSTSSQSTRRRELLQPLAPVRGLGLELEPVLADVDELVEADDPPRVGARPAADAGDERVAAVQAAELGARLLRHGGLVRHVDDRREHAVDVEQERGPLRVPRRAARAARSCHGS